MNENKFRIKDKIETEIRRKSKMKDGLKLTGHAVLELRKKDGTVIERQEQKNLIVNTGLERVTYLLGEGIGTGFTGFSYIGIGTGTTSPAVGNTALETEVERELATISYVANYKCQFEKTFDFGTGTSYAITEAGMFDGATPTGSVMLDRFTFTAKNVDVDTDLYVKITITVS